MKPEAFISTQKNRLKIYPRNTVYLKNKQSFEIELFNPTHVNYLACIEVEDKDISSGNSGIILKPGERVFIERWLDSSNKLEFQTYEVESNNPQVDSAISRNGLVEIKFYKEQKNNFNINWTPIIDTYFYNNIGDPVLGREITNNSTDYSSSINFTQTSLNSNIVEEPLKSTLISNTSRKIKKKVTGKTGKGDVSDQKFTTETGYSWEIFADITTVYKIEAADNKPVTTKQVVTRYCTECGTKMKKGWRFCATCGTKS